MFPTGAPGYIASTFLNGVSFVDGWEQNFFISKWSMHQLVCDYVLIIFCHSQHFDLDAREGMNSLLVCPLLMNSFRSLFLIRFFFFGFCLNVSLSPNSTTLIPCSVFYVLICFCLDSSG